jgi:hypothetical protein
MLSLSTNYWSRRLNGTVEIEEITRVEGCRNRIGDLIARSSIHIWKPPYQLTRHLPDNFDVRLNCWHLVGGARVFFPAASPLAFIVRAALASELMFADRGQFDKSTPYFSFGEARLFFQYARHTQDYLGETRRLGQALNIVRSGRPDIATVDIVPDDVGIGPDWSGTRWSLATLKQEGLRAAQQAGVKNPTPDDLLSYGLYADAMLNPLNESNPAKAESIVRLAFFTCGEAHTKIDSAAIEYVASQIKESLRDHLHDSTEKFDQWLEDPKSNLISRIAKRKDCHLTRQEVRVAVTELGWIAFKMLAQCIDCFSCAFEAALPHQMTEAERTRFSQIFRAQSGLGNFPLLLLHERFQFLMPAILEMWNDPAAQRPTAVLLRMIWVYSQLVTNRRAADRQLMRRDGHYEVGYSTLLDEPPVGEEDPRKRMPKRSSRRHNRRPQF